MKYGQLIKKCQELIDSYNPNIMTPDSHAQQFLQNLKIQDAQRVFLKQIFYGYQRYKNFIQASNTVIFTRKKHETNRKHDSTLFSIFTYLICFRMDELPFNQFRKIVLSQDFVKMNVFLNFIFDFDLLRNQVFQTWSQYLEMDYIENKLMPALGQRKQKCAELVNRVAENATGKKTEFGITESMNNIPEDNQKKKVTIPQQFNLTKPKPKQIQQIEKIQIGFKAKPVPLQKNDLKNIENQKKKRRQEITNNVKKFYEQHKNQDEFKLQTTKRPSNLPRLKQQAQNQLTKQLKTKIQIKPIPKYKQPQIKLNIAAILRQQKRLTSQQKQEQQKIKNLQINMRDESQFEQWQKQMKEKDQFQYLETQQKRKIEMELSRQAAIKAYDEKIGEKKKEVQDIKQMKQQQKKQRQKLNEQIIINKKKVIEQIQDNRQNVVIERQKIIEKNKKLVEEDKQQRKKIIQKKKQQDKLEMQKKKQIIQQIKQMQKNIKAKPKQQIQYISMGLLQQMNLQQLKLRLQQVKQQQKKQQQQRRQQNIKKKQDFKSTLNHKKNTIMAAREELSKNKQAERIKKKQQAEQQRKRHEQARIKSLLDYKKKQQQKQKQKQRQKQKLAKQIKQTDQRRMFLMQGQAAQQAHAFLNLEKGEERQLLDRQNQKLVTEFKNQMVKQKCKQIIADAFQKEVQNKIQFNKLYNQKQQEANKIAQALRQDDQTTKAMMFHQIKTYESKHNQNMAKSHPFKTKMTQSIQNKSKKN